MTAKQIAGYLKARRDQRGSTFGGITFNDGYNVPTFGITKAVHDAINRSMNDEYGMESSSHLTSAGVKKAIRNHPISEQSKARHATKKKAAGRPKKIKISTSRPIGWTITDPARPGWSETGTTTSDELKEAFQPKRHHTTKKKTSPAQLDREIAEALSKSGKGQRPSKLGGDYFTVVLTRAKPASTNEWNRLPAGWDSQTRGAFPSKYAAYKWAREKLLRGAPFTIRYVPLGQ